MREYANAFYDAQDGMLHVTACRQPNNEEKSDGFVFVYRDQVLLMDGGNDNAAGAFETLMALRDAWLTRAGVTEKFNTRYVLRFSWIVTHYHIDHVMQTLKYILPSPYFEIDRLICPAESAFSQSPLLHDPSYATPFLYGDLRHRPAILKALADYQPACAVTDVPFGQQLAFSSPDGRVKYEYFASPVDWGMGDPQDFSTPLGRMMEMYYSARHTPEGFTYDKEFCPKNMVVALCNSNSIFLKITMGDRSFLFTGDGMKKTAFPESLDEMLARWGTDKLRADVVKYPHHGIKRDAALPVVMKLCPKVLLFTCQRQTVTALPEFQQTFTGRWFVTSQDSGCTFATDGQGLWAGQEKLI